jgi:polyisoprenoid-binding protein YceI
MSAARVVAPGTWSADPSRSTVAFSVARLPSGTLRGRFEDVVAQLDVGDDGDATLCGVVGTGSIVIPGSRPAARAASADLLDTRRFPRMTFTSSAVEISGGVVQVDGRLTVRDTTLPVTAAGGLTSGDGGRVLVLTLETLVDRRQFGVDLTGPFPGGVVCAYETRLQVELVLHRRWEL